MTRTLLLHDRFAPPKNHSAYLEVLDPKPRGGCLKVFDASDPSNLRQLSSIPVTAAYDVIASNHVLLVASPTGLDQYDYSDPSHIVALSHLSISQSQQ